MIILFVVVVVAVFVESNHDVCGHRKGADVFQEDAVLDAFDGQKRVVVNACLRGFTGLVVSNRCCLGTLDSERQNVER